MRHLSALVLLFLLSAPVSAGAQTPLPDASLTVSGQGSILRPPDMASVSATIVTNDESASAAVSHNNAVYEAVKRALGALGIPSPDLHTQYYNVNFNPRPEPMPMRPQNGTASYPMPYPQQRFGYVVTRNISVTVARVEQAGSTVDSLVRAGAANIGGISFGLKDQRGAYAAALAAAVGDAEAQATALASAAHVRLVRVRTITTGSGTGPVFFSRAAASGVPAPEPPTDLPPSDVNVRASVTITYLIAS